MQTWAGLGYAVQGVFQAPDNKCWGLVCGHVRERSRGKHLQKQPEKATRKLEKNLEHDPEKKH